MASHVQLQSLNMNNMLFYVVYSRHVSFVSSLTQQMIANVREYYADYMHVVQALDRLAEMLRDKKLPHEVGVVVFFFFLCIDSRMRHWILNSELSPEEEEQRQKRLRRHLQFIPSAQMYLKYPCQPLFLGQTATFTAIKPQSAVGILLPMSSDGFFEDLVNGGDFDAFAETYERIKVLVACA